MTRVVDTSAWIEWLKGSPFGEELGHALPKTEDWLVPTIVQLELSKWAVREAGEAKSERIIAFTTTCIVVPLTSTIAITAADFCARFRLATADAIVYATAQAFGADLLTCDRHFAHLKGVEYRPKAG